MKRMIRMASLLLALVCLLCACQTESAPTTGTPTTIPTTAQPAGPDFARALPTLKEKFVTGAPADGDLVLARDGSANATIVIPAGHAEAKAAAADLSSYLQKITGAAFETVTDNQTLPEGNLILVGPTKKTAELGIEPHTGYPYAEKLTIARKDNCLILCGNDDAAYTGTQNAVTCFLEEAGCGWFAEDELWQIVPEMPTLAVKTVDMTVTPVMHSRSYGNVSSALTERWYCGGTNTLDGQRIWIYIPKSTFATHPEWFALVDGTRHDPSSYSISEWQYCYSNQALAEAYAQKVIEYFDKNPNCLTMTAAANDGWTDGWCECDDCAALGNKADQALTFANRVAEIVCKTYPDKYISTLAYHDTFLPPEKTKAHENVEVMFCLETSPLDDLMADRQIHSGFNNINKIEYSQSWLDNVAEWIEVSDLQHKTIWGWFCIEDYWMGAPWIQGNVASRNIDVFESLGVTRVFVDGPYPTDKLDQPLRWPLYYTFGKCMYFGDMTGEEVLYDACQKLYGAAADEMFLYYRLLADCAQYNDSPSGINWVPPTLLEVYGSNVKMARDLVANARAKMDQLTPEQQERVENQLRGWMYIDAYI